MKKTALLSVYHKEGIVEFAKALVDRHWEILASGGTAKVLRENNIPVRDVSELVGGKAILGHRVVTLSREIHAGLLARDLPEDEETLRELGIPRIDLVCVDLYPLRDEVAKPNSTRESVIEMTDIGGPTVLRSAAKGERIVICDPEDRRAVIAWMDTGSPDKQDFIDYLAAKAEAVVAGYCLTSSRARKKNSLLFDGMIGTLSQQCKYGENAWQAPAGLYQTNFDDPLALSNFKVVEGSAPSYNNWCDIDRALQTVTHAKAILEDQEIAVGMKHGNPCGAAFGIHPDDAIQKMVTGDPRAIFGGFVMTTFEINEFLANKLLRHDMKAGKRLLDGIVAPYFTAAARELLARKEGKCRLIANPALETLNRKNLDQEPRFRQVRGGFLKQPNYTYVLDFDDPHLAHYGSIDTWQEDNLRLAWAIGSTSNSNTITITNSGKLIGNGVGQQDRVGCCELAIKRAHDAGHDTVGAVAYSDSFFPFPDGPEVLAKAGIKAILTSSGSVRDDEVKEMCARHNVALLMIPDAIGRGFYNH